MASLVLELAGVPKIPLVRRARQELETITWSMRQYFAGLEWTSLALDHADHSLEKFLWPSVYSSYLLPAFECQPLFLKSKHLMACFPTIVAVSRSL
jgi:hypothetical protein